MAKLPESRALKMVSLALKTIENDHQQANNNSSSCSSNYVTTADDIMNADIIFDKSTQEIPTNNFEDSISDIATYIETPEYNIAELGLEIGLEWTEGKTQEENNGIELPSKSPSIHDKSESDFELESAEEIENELSNESTDSEANVKQFKTKRENSKHKREKGFPYVGYRRMDKKVLHDVARSERKLEGACNSLLCSKSKKRHCNLYSVKHQKHIFKSFWKLSWEQKKLYVSSLVDLKTKNRETAEQSRRNSTYVYHLKYNKDMKKEVCKKMFLGTLGLKEWMVHNWIQKSKHGIFQGQERQHSVNISFQTKKDHLTEWLNSLAKMPSHYARRDTNKMYLEGEFPTVMSVFKLYKEKCVEEGCVPLSRSIFNIIFKKLNLSIFTPRKDQCDLCVSFKTNQVSPEEYAKHRADKDRARLEKNSDKEKAKQELHYAFVMDLEAVQLCPKIEASALYYSQRLKVHNFTIYNLGTSQCTCYWWHECEGELFSSIFASIIIDHLKNHCLAEKKPIVILSDGCGYQNRNAVLSNALLQFSMSNNIVIEQKYLVKGHTQNECDSVHSLLERKIKKRDIYLPSDFIKIAKEARLKPMPLDVCYVNHSCFKNYADKNYQKYFSIRPGYKKNDPEVKDLRAIRYEPNGVIQYKLNFDDNYEELNQRPNKNMKPVQYENLYKTSVKLTLSKWRDLQKLKTVLPIDTHSFYDQLPHETELKDRKKIKSNSS